MESNFRILYIIGAGRSGTTLLDIVLGNADDFFSAGELNRFTKRDGLPHDPRDSNVDAFWKRVNDKLFSKNLKNPRSYYEQFEKLEYHNAFFRLNSNLMSDYFNIYQNYQKQLFSAIYESSQQNSEITIIDSSKYPLRGFFLSKIFGDKVSLLYIKRQPSDIVESFQKQNIEQPSKGRLSSHLYLLVVNAISNRVIQLVKGRNKTSVILYEQFISSPLQTIEQIERDLNIDLHKPKEIIISGSTFKVGHLFDGNRLRLEQEIAFKKNMESKGKSGHLLNRLFLPLHKLVWYKTITK